MFSYVSIWVRTRINKDLVCKNRALQVTLHFGHLEDQYLTGSSILRRSDAVFLWAQIEPYHIDISNLSY